MSELLEARRGLVDPFVPSVRSSLDPSTNGHCCLKGFAQHNERSRVKVDKGARRNKRLVLPESLERRRNRICKDGYNAKEDRRGWWFYVEKR